MPPDSNPLDLAGTDSLRQAREVFERFMLEYQFAVETMLARVSILSQEFLHLHRYNPIEHVTSRVKTPQSIIEKVFRKGCPPQLTEIRQQITDIAGVRITCSFVADTYRVLKALTTQHDLNVVDIKDYIANPKPNGYRSLHALVEVPVFLSTGPIPVVVEVQIRTLAMDLWASLEHKIFYKYSGEVPATLVQDLSDAAQTAERLDHQMERLYSEVHGQTSREGHGPAQIDDSLLERFWGLARGFTAPAAPPPSPPADALDQPTQAGTTWS
jgi:putative GTP pyrophosphokinase